MDYNKTIHLPKTDFPMRAGLAKREPAMLEQAEEKQLYHKMVARNEGKPLFVLHDGPPYANGNIHIGTAMNKILKDIIVKEKNMTGYCSPYVPGWDTHGLPIESAVLKDKKIHREEMSTADFRDVCRDYALSYIDKMTAQFKRLGVLGEWENPYITLKPSFEAEQVKIFGKMAEKGLIYKGMKSVYWCPHDQTALAEAEIEYQDDPCTTLYVKFPLADDKGKLEAYAPKEKISFVIWTTTPWTIPGNVAISLNADFQYILLEVPGGEVYILAEDLAKDVCAHTGIDYAACRVLARLPGSEFELMTARHPLLPQESVILTGDHVTQDSGTGCVHTAPGFGGDDFAVCKRYDDAGLTHFGVPVPVNGKGIMTDSRYNGTFYAKGNERVIADLEAEGFLLAKEQIVHSYPHCWRCKEPIIYRATEQWFCSVDAIKDEAVAACENISWHPAWGKDRMISMISERSDWCISRQRVWGVPIPVFYCEDCGEAIISPETVEKVSDLFREHGSNIWFSSEAKDLLPEGFTCPKCAGSAFTKETDIMDVWFDSGSTHTADLAQRPYLHYPADIYLEGGDQYRGWFQSSMLTSIAANGVAPYRQIITHGWTVDGEGRAMHKSLGNAVSPDDVINTYGADMLRLWVASADYTQDMRISDEIMKQLSQAYLKIRNTARYMIGNLSDFNPDTDSVPYGDLTNLDHYILHVFNLLVADVRKNYDSYEFHLVYRAIYNFCVVDLSGFYLDILKDRLYCGDKKTREAARTVLFIILDGLTRLLAPILAFTSDEIWASMPHRKSDRTESVLFNDFPAFSSDYVLPEDKAKGWDELIAFRNVVNKALETARDTGVKKNQDAAVTVFLTGDAASAHREGRFLADYTPEDLATLCIVSSVTLEEKEGEGLTADNLPGVSVSVRLSDAPKCPRCWNHHSDVGKDPEHPLLCPRCAAVVRAEGIVSE